METITTTFNGQELTIIESAEGRALSDEQVGIALGYADPAKGIQKLVERDRKRFNELDGLSVTVNLTATDGKVYPTRVWGKEGVIAISFLAKTETAADVRAMARKVLVAPPVAAAPADPLTRMADYVITIDQARSKQIAAVGEQAAQALEVAQEAKALASANQVDPAKVTQDAANILRWEQARAAKLRVTLENLCKEYGNLRALNGHGDRATETINLNRTLKQTYGKRDMLTVDQLAKAITFVQSLVSDLPSPDQTMGL